MCIKNFKCLSATSEHSTNEIDGRTDGRIDFIYTEARVQIS
jgi:hypothetical protein